jgi:GrpB-like predicted nucleotidyltransferase (UPF0157 family)
MRKVEVVPHDPKWQEMFEIESKRVRDALGENVIAIHQISIDIWMEKMNSLKK